MHDSPRTAWVRVVAWGVLVATVPRGPARAETLPGIAECESAVEAHPRSLEAYQCLLPHVFTSKDRVLRFIDARVRRDSSNPRARLHGLILHYLAGDAWKEEGYDRVATAFAREHDLAGEFSALAWHVSVRCYYQTACDAGADALLARAGELARRSGRLDLQQHWELWRMKVAANRRQLSLATESEARLIALGQPANLWLRVESLQMRAHLAALLLDYGNAKKLSLEMLESIGPEDPRRAVALGGIATASAHLAFQGLEPPELAERLLRAALAEQERVGLALWFPEIGFLPARLQLGILLGQTPEGVAVVRSALDGYRSRQGMTNSVWADLALSELLSTASPPRLEEALQLSEDAVADADRQGIFAVAPALVQRSRVRFRLGHLAAARADGHAALDVIERARGLQEEMRIRLLFAETSTFAYHSLAGALLVHREPDDLESIDEALGVMEGLRGRGLMETLLAKPGPGTPQIQPPALARIQGLLEPEEAMLSFQVWRPEPSLYSPYREGSSWLTLVTRDRAQAFRIPDADVLEAQIRAWTGLLERRDGADRSPGGRLHEELLRPALDALAPDVTRLIIIPDGPLHRLPFDALAPAGGGYVAERFQISVVPSASLWVRLRTTPRLPPGRILVLADPSGPGAVLAVGRDSSTMVGALAHARGEAEVAAASFPRGSELRVGDAASEAVLKSARLDGVSLLHLATHALSDVQNPERSAVLLAPGSAAEDGRLEPEEIARLPLGGKTVVLAGCETSAGRVFRGEGVMSLARAFFSAGASSVVGTLDKARDDEAAEFFTSMYGALGRGTTIGEAVVAAKREAIRRGAPPAAWAEVVLLGDAGAHPRAREVSEALSVLLTGAAVALFGLGIGRRWVRGWRGQG
ncbi:MAG TPA: CHAT domain-containing protein [Myxococcaceae bacterium]|nr:CHAT domain-containing protein [Myxococcaceae bacterium]